MAPSFGWIVVASAACVVGGALCYTAWYLLYHEHSHTVQQLCSLKSGDGTHTHFYFHRPPTALATLDDVEGADGDAAEEGRR